MKKKNLINTVNIVVNPLLKEYVLYLRHEFGHKNEISSGRAWCVALPKITPPTHNNAQTFEGNEREKSVHIPRLIQMSVGLNIYMKMTTKQSI